MLVACTLVVACSGGPPDKERAAQAKEQASAAVEQALQGLDLEKTDLKLGFIKLTDCAPLLIAKEKGFFADEGLNVAVEAQANWKILLDRVISGELDGAHMLPGQAIGATIGFGTQADIVAPFAMGLNTLAITVSNDIWAKMKKNVPDEDGKPVHPIKAEALKPVVRQYKAQGKPFPMGMVFPTSTHNYHLRYWLAAGGLHPGLYTPDDTRGVVDADVLISVTPPPQMPATLESGTIHGYSVGEPWNQQAVIRGIGVPVVTAYHIWRRTPEKVFGVRKDWVEQHPRTAVAVTKALLRAAIWLDAEGGKNREEAAKIFSKAEYIGADYEVIVGPITGVYQYEKGDTRPLAEFNVYLKDHASFPYYSDAVWYLTQMRRWGQIGETKADAWYHETAKRVYRPDIYREAARALVDAGHLTKEGVPWETDGYRPETADFIDGIVYDGRKPLEYLSKHAIGLKDPVAQRGRSAGFAGPLPAAAAASALQPLQGATP
jgi:nitrate/nitrite transport system substrate-binding protein